MESSTIIFSAAKQICYKFFPSFRKSQHFLGADLHSRNVSVFAFLMREMVRGMCADVPNRLSRGLLLGVRASVYYELVGTIHAGAICLSRSQPSYASRLN